MRICSSINQSKWEIQQCQSSSVMIDNWKHAIEWVLLETELGRKKIRFLRHSNVESKQARKRKSKETTKKTRRNSWPKLEKLDIMWYQGMRMLEVWTHGPQTQIMLNEI